jgi:hypothetical protein
MKTLPAVLLSMLFIPFVARSQEAATIEATFKAAGNCGQCKTRIEKALSIEGVKEALWNKRTHSVTVAFTSPPLTLDSLQQRVAAVGHDTEKFRAADSVYTALPACCRYRETKKHH